MKARRKVAGLHGRIADDAGDYVNILGFAAKTGDGRLVIEW